MELTWPTAAKATFSTFRRVRRRCSSKSVGQCLNVERTLPAILANGAEWMTTIGPITTIDERRGGTRDTAT